MPPTCTRCGSEKIVPDVSLADRYGDVGEFTGRTQVAVHGAPDAWIFKDTVAAGLLADVCGNCGHVELHVENHAAPYDRYLKSRAGSRTE